jgi:hypothetical protein
MDFRGESLLGDIAGLQAEIDALDTRVTSLETRMTTAETNITTLQGGHFTGRVFQYSTIPTPFMIDQLTNDINLSNDLLLYHFVTPTTPHLQNYFEDGSVFHLFTCGVMNGASASLNFILSNDNGATPFGGGIMTLTVGAGSQHFVTVEAFLMIYDISGPTSATAKFVMRGYVSQSSGTPPLQAEVLEVHGISIDPTTDLNFMSMWKKDASVATTFTRTQGWIEALS